MRCDPCPAPQTAGWMELHALHSSVCSLLQGFEGNRPHSTIQRGIFTAMVYLGDKVIFCGILAFEVRPGDYLDFLSVHCSVSLFILILLI